MTILDLIETFIGPLDNTIGKLLLSVGFLGFIGLALGLIGINKLNLFIIMIAGVLMFAGFGWIPIWIIIMLGIGAAILLLTNVLGGNRNG